MTVRALLPRVFEALVNVDDLRRWWSSEARVEAELGGRYETHPAEGTQEGTVLALEAPRKLSFSWPMEREGARFETTVSYELLPKGEETVVHVVHRSPRILGHEWRPPWQRAMASLKAYLETGAGPLDQAAPGPPAPS